MGGRTTRSLRHFLLVCGGLLVGLAGEACEAAKLHVVIASDTAAPDIGKDMRVGANLLEGRIRDNMPEAGLNLVTVGVEAGTRVDRNEILRAIYGLPVQPDDAVMVYYAGHGAYNPNRDAYGRPYGTYAVFTGSSSVLYESEIRGAVGAMRARLSIVVLDCCNSLRPIPSVPFAPALAFRGPNQDVSPLFDELFFRRSGTYSLESSAPGQYAFVEPRRVLDNGEQIPIGSVFTTSLIGVFCDSNSRLTWDQVRQRTQAEVSTKFQNLRNDGQLMMQGVDGEITQTDQTLTVIANDLR